MGTSIRTLAQKPPLGWNSFDCYGAYVNEQQLLDNARVLAERLKPHGYEYVVLDIAWFVEYELSPDFPYPKEKHSGEVMLDEWGRCVPAPCFFPNGLKSVGDAIHDMGLKFGIHIMRGIPRKAVELNLPIKGTPYRAADIADTSSTCVWCCYNYGIDMSKPGAQEYYNSYVDLLAEWGADFIKADDLVPYPAEIEGIANAIEQNDRDMVYSLSPGNKNDLAHLPSYRRANMLRITSDIWDRRGDLDRAFAAWEKYQGTQEPGFWPDLDMIPFGHLRLCRPKALIEATGNALLEGEANERMCELTDAQKRTFITMRALSASPLFMGGDLPTSDEESFDLITNSDILACNQNGVMGHKVYEAAPIQAWTTPEQGKENAGWLGVFNRSEDLVDIAIPLSELGLSGEQRITALWNDVPCSVANETLSAVLQPDDVLFLRYK